MGCRRRTVSCAALIVHGTPGQPGSSPLAWPLHVRPCTLCRALHAHAARRGGLVARAVARLARVTFSRLPLSSWDTWTTSLMVGWNVRRAEPTLRAACDKQGAQRGTSSAPFCQLAHVVPIRAHM